MELITGLKELKNLTFFRVMVILFVVVFLFGGVKRLFPEYITKLVSIANKHINGDWLSLINVIHLMLGLLVILMLIILIFMAFYVRHYNLKQRQPYYFPKTMKAYDNIAVNLYTFALLYFNIRGLVYNFELKIDTNKVFDLSSMLVFIFGTFLYGLLFFLPTEEKNDDTKEVENNS